MADSRYFVEISRQGSVLGAGFFVMPHLVLTARHCVKGVLDDDIIDLHCADGEELTGRLDQLALDADLALIEITKPRTSPIELLRALPPRRREAWTNPYRPAADFPYLGGVITHPKVSYACADGATVEAIQLACEEEPGDYSGYSGSPIERLDEKEPALLGILLEQYLDRVTPERATNVLFAATMNDALRRFERFNVDHLLGVLHPQAEVSQPAGRPVPQPRADAAQKRPARGAVREKLDEASALVDLFKQWADEGVLDPSYVNEATLRIAKSVVESGISEMTR